MKDNEEQVPAEGHRSWVRRLALGTVVFVLLGLLLAVLEARTSWLQSRWFSSLAREATFHLEEGPSPEARFPDQGPFDYRLGYTRIPEMLERTESAGFRIVSQIRISDGFGELMDRGLFPIYHEKDQAGLTLLDRRGRIFLDRLHPRRIYLSFDSVPPLVWRSLLDIENRELLRPGHLRQNPAVEWDRFSLSLWAYLLQKLGGEGSVQGASTLATQIEKYRHSPEGRTTSGGEKFRQMTSASIRAYLNGPNTLESRKRIVTAYLNTVPLAASRGYGEIIGISDGLWAWFGSDFDEANRLLRADPDTLGPEAASRRGQVYRQVLSLLLAQRRPTYHLASGSGQEALKTLTDWNLERMMGDGVIPRDLGEFALRAEAVPLMEAPALPSPPFAELKAQNKIRAGLLPLLDIPQLYDLDRLDLTVETSIDLEMQALATQFLRRLGDLSYVQGSGLAGPRMLERGDPARVIYSFTLTERDSLGNHIRVQTDNFNGPFDINGGSRIELGSTAKLRTLVTYLEVVERAHSELSGLPADSLSRLSIQPSDHLLRWAVGYLQEHPGAGPDQMLRASLERRYSADPGESFRTGGGLQRFTNFDSTHNGRVLSVAEGFNHSVNLVWVRVMRDVVNHVIHRQSGSALRLLEEEGDSIRQAYLTRFADEEGGVFVARFYRQYAGVPTDSILPMLVNARRLGPVSMAWAFRAVKPAGPLDEMTSFIDHHAQNAFLTAGSAADLYRRTEPMGQTLADLGYLASVHPLELWVARYLLENPGASWPEVRDASHPQRIDVYRWLFRTSRRDAQDLRIRSILEMEAFSEILRMWRRVGYPFQHLVPSLGTAIGSSGDRPAALAELVGIVLNDGVRMPTTRVERLRFAPGTPFQVDLEWTPHPGERVLSPQVAAVAREAMLSVVEKGTGQRLRGALVDAQGLGIPMGGKTGTGDNRFRVFAPGGRAVESRPVNRTSTFVFFLGDRYFGVITAYVPGPEAGAYTFTSSLPLELLRRLLPELGLYPVGASLSDGG